MPTAIDLPLRRDKTTIWDGVAQKRVLGVWTDVDLTGATLRLVARAAVGDEDPTPVLSLSSDAPTSSGSISIDPDQVTNKGRYTVRVEAAATSDPTDWPDDAVRYYPFEIELEETTGELTTLAEGVVKYAPDVR
jgi:hypothetical protein